MECKYENKSNDDINKYNNDSNDDSKGMNDQIITTKDDLKVNYANNDIITFDASINEFCNTNPTKIFKQTQNNISNNNNITITECPSTKILKARQNNVSTNNNTTIECPSMKKFKETQINISNNDNTSTECLSTKIFKETQNNISTNDNTTTTEYSSTKIFKQTQNKTNNNNDTTITECSLTSPFYAKTRSRAKYTSTTHATLFGVKRESSTEEHWKQGCHTTFDKQSWKAVKDDSIGCCVTGCEYWYHERCLINDHGYTTVMIQAMKNDVFPFECPRCGNKKKS